jgi:geranylgeranyl diphosphate synthase type I
MPHIMDIFTTRAERLRARIEAFLAAEAQRAATISKWATDALPRLAAFAGHGKLLRGNLALLGCELGGGALSDSSYDIGAALEIVHSSILVHDDIIDEDLQRRGAPTLHAAYAQQYAATHGLAPAHARRIGEALATCAADAGFFTAYTLLCNAAPEADVLRRILRLWSREFSRVALGEMDDIELSLAATPASLESILQFYRSKTACYTFCVPLETGLLCARAAAEIIAPVRALGEQLGVIFQIKDDELGLFGEATAIGKPVGSDVMQNKKTVYHHYLFARVGAADRARVQRLFGAAHVSVEDMAYVRRLLEDTGAKAAVDELVANHARAACACVDAIPVSPAQQEQLRQLVAYSVTRTK